MSLALTWLEMFLQIGFDYVRTRDRFPYSMSLWSQMQSHCDHSGGDFKTAKIGILFFMFFVQLAYVGTLEYNYSEKN